MSRTLTFQQVADSRCGEKPIDVAQWAEAIETALKDLGATVEVGKVRYYTWKMSCQWRIRFYVRKPKGITWDQVYEAINAIKSVPYDFV